MNTKDGLYAAEYATAASEDRARSGRDRRSAPARERRGASGDARGREDPAQWLRQQIASRLKLLGLTERQASLQAGLSPDCVKEIVAGRRRPRAATLKRIGRVLGCEFEG